MSETDKIATLNRQRGAVKENRALALENSERPNSDRPPQNEGGKQMAKMVCAAAAAAPDSPATVTYFVLKEVTTKQPPQKVDMSRFVLPPDVTLADKTFDQPSDVHILLGADILFQVLLLHEPDVILECQPASPPASNSSQPTYLPRLLNTAFGYVVGGGNLPFPPGSGPGNKVVSLICSTCNTDLNENIAQFWDTEKVPEVFSEKQSEFETCEKIFQETIQLKNNSFEVALPLKMPLDSINETLEGFEWSYVNTSENPANCLSKGVLPHELEQHQLWWNAPQFLHNINYNVSQVEVPTPESVPELKKEPAAGFSTAMDMFYFPFRPAHKIIAAWTAVDDVTLENGALYVVPGSHKPGVLHAHGQLQDSNYLYHGILKEDLLAPTHDRIHLEMSPGDTVFFHPLLVHGSGPNRIHLKMNPGDTMFFYPLLVLNVTKVIMNLFYFYHGILKETEVAPLHQRIWETQESYRKSISCHYANSECHYVDLTGTVQEVVEKDILNEAKRRGFNLDFQWVTKPSNDPMNPGVRVYQPPILCHYANSECHYVDLTGTVQEVVEKDILNEAKRRGFNLDFQDVWRYRSKQVVGVKSNL
ncbi:phytanoyl-CoA dioxygenase (PhyH) domain-containing protein [Phthorimaea operculella]|nr:phytanoyl-CoA dioxygenase (PhyH) domain-containing protein [Phthorimaea operculella]